MKRLTIWIEPKRKQALKQYCRKNKITMSRLLTSMIADRLAKAEEGE